MPEGRKGIVVLLLLGDYCIFVEARNKFVRRNINKKSIFLCEGEKAIELVSLGTYFLSYSKILSL